MVTATLLVLMPSITIYHTRDMTSSTRKLGTLSTLEALDTGTAATHRTSSKKAKTCRLRFRTKAEKEVWVMRKRGAAVYPRRCGKEALETCGLTEW